MIAAFTACNSNDDAKVGSASTTDSTKKTETYVYKADYSSDFEIGDSKYSHLLLDVWKAWDDGDLSKSKDHFADSVTMLFANGYTFKATRDSFLIMGQKIRDNYTRMQSTTEAFIPLKSKDKDQNWVAIWGKEISTSKEGKTDSVYLHETWRFNKDGKIDMTRQYHRTAKPPKE
jgi:hypothetical protein